MKKGDKKMNLLNKIGIFAGSLFVAAVATYIYSPVILSNATDMSRVSFDLEPVISLVLDTDNLVLNVVPTSDGTFTSGSITATVLTNSTGGYKLYFSSEDDDTDMVHSDSNVSDVIASDFTGTVTSTTMPVNKWGYSLDNTDFRVIPTLTDHLTLTEVNHYPTELEKDSTVYIGTKVSNALTAGSYSKNLLFSAIAHDAIVHTTIHSIMNMQDMTPEICSATTTPLASATSIDWDGTHYGDRNYVPRATLVDSRDQKTYLVSKLADGNCWMSQNLAIDLTEDVPITISNNDGTTDTATPDYSTQTSTKIAWNKTGDEWRSYHPNSSEAYYVNGVTKSSAPTDAGNAYLWESAGNYYNWYAATGGTGTSYIEEGEAPSSICPKGWRLPTSEGPKSFINLFTTTIGSDDLLTTEAGTAFRADPLNFTLAGGYNWQAKKMNHQGVNGFYWMSTAYDYENAYRMSAQTGYIKPQGDYHKGYGFPIRCVAI